MTQDIDLSSIFREVTKVLKANKQELNDADEYNHNHGSNMVNTFSLLQKAVESVKDKPVAEQLDMPARPCVPEHRVRSTGCNGLERSFP